jgi:hypothetical protein
MELSEAFPSNFLQATDLKNRNITVTIARYDREEIGRDKRIKPILYFHGARKGLVLNKTNARAIANSYGTNLDKWIGRQIILYPRMVDFGGEEVLAIRVRIPQAGASLQRTAAPPPPPAVEEPDQFDELNPPPIDSIGKADEMDDEIPF